MRFQPLNSFGVYQIISLIAFGLILSYLSFSDIKKLSISGFDLGLIGVYTIINSLVSLQKFGVSYVFSGLKAIAFSLIFFLIIFLITKRGGIGIGDILFFAIASANIGPKNTFEALILAFSCGAIVSLILIFTGKLNFKERIPFIPFLSFGIYLSIFLDFFYI